MKRVFLQLACALLLGCMLLNISGLFLVFCYQQLQLKREMKQYLGQHLQHADVSVFSFSKQDQKLLEWEGSDEFSLNGQMYDVLKKVQHGAQVTIYCVMDKMETALIQQFLQHSGKQKPLKGKADVRTQLLSWHYLLADKIKPVHFASIKLLHHTCYTFFLPFTERDVLAPPPRIIS